VRRGCTGEALHRLVRDGFVNAERIQVQGKQPSPVAFYLRISDAGRKALARQDGRPRRGKISTRLVLVVLFALGLLAGVAAGALMTSPGAWKIAMPSGPHTTASPSSVNELARS
jgi:hypothetical protein